MTMSFAVEAQGLKKFFDKNSLAINNIDLKLEKGKIHVVAGPNGAGKTTLLRILYTELLPTEGTVTVLSHDIYSNPTEIREHIGVMPQEIVLYEDLSVWEHVYFLALLKGLNKKQATTETMRLLNMFGFQERRKTLIRDLSGGLKRQVLLIQSLIGGADLLLLDEPTVGLDPQVRRTTWNIIQQIHRENKSTIIITTHYLDEVQDFVDRVIILNKGEIVMDGDVNSILKRLDYDIMARLKNVPLDRLGSIDKALLALGMRCSTLSDGTVMVWISKRSVGAFLEFLKGLDIKLENMDFQRPSLEEAYLTCVGVQK